MPKANKEQGKTQLTETPVFASESGLIDNTHSPRRNQQVIEEVAFDGVELCRRVRKPSQTDEERDEEEEVHGTTAFRLQEYKIVGEPHRKRLGVVAYANADTVDIGVTLEAAM